MCTRYFLAAVLIFVLFGVLALVVLFVVLLVALFVHFEFLPLFFLRLDRFSSLPGNLGFILSFEEDTCN